MSRRAIRLSVVASCLAISRLAAAQPIEDNSFLVEEAYNQGRGVVQHIGTFSRATTGHGWLFSFTQEWPAPAQLHQLSYTFAVQRPEAAGASVHVGDLLLNYRRQVVAREHLLFAPRLTALIPTGSASAGTGLGGVGAQANLPLTAFLSPSLVSHTNVGGTLVPRGRTSDGDRLRYANVTLGQSLIWLARPDVNLMLESVYSATSSRVTDARGSLVGAPNDGTLTVSPGFRFALNYASGLQIVPGAAVPVTMRGGLGAVNAEAGVLLYLSVEHSFGRRVASR